MDYLLEAYRRVIDSDYVKKQGNGHNGPCPLCGGGESKLRSDRFMVWEDRTEGIGEACAEQGIPGVWHCRRCGAGGDTIAFLMEIEGMDFKTALAELGIKGQKRKKNNSPKPRGAATQADYHPRDLELAAPDPAAWQAYAEKLLAEAEAALPKQKSALKWLAARGISLQVAQVYRLGYLPEENAPAGRFRPRAALGLTPVLSKATGKKVNSIHIPRGIVIPAFDEAKRLIRLRIRRPAQDIQEERPRKYMVLEGSNPRPVLLESSNPPHLACYVVVEAELDAMLVHHISGGVVGAFAALTNRGKPDKEQHAVLENCASILNALDYDPREVTREDGSVVMESPGASGWEWWRDTYRQAKRWPVPQEKDPGDAWAAGVDLLAWLAAGLPRSVKLETSRASAPLEPLAAGLSSCGEGGAALENTRSEKEVGQTDSHASVQMAESVAELVAMWRSEAPGLRVALSRLGGLAPSIAANTSTSWEDADRVFSRIRSSIQMRGLIAGHSEKIISPYNLLNEKE